MSSSASAITFDAKVVDVTDGDTVKVVTGETCTEGKNCRAGLVQYRIRLAEIDAPERKQPYGTKSKQALLGMVGGKQVKVEQTDIDRYGRIVAQLYAGQLWVNGEMVKTGNAWVYPQYAKTQALFQMQDEAKKQQQGLWSLPEGERVEPWKWRKAH
ncbi:thermonuclease family protein [Pseudaeromonas paramecii]|uniref:thermonuclease family protein n=1 Tax=Pseudaeromonas paramecii TaxID=2138166 RepID=UPI0031E9EA57